MHREIMSNKPILGFQAKGRLFRKDCCLNNSCAREPDHARRFRVHTVSSVKELLLFVRTEEIVVGSVRH